jgi:hypothetical protein
MNWKTKNFDFKWEFFKIKLIGKLRFSSKNGNSSRKIDWKTKSFDKWGFFNIKLIGKLRVSTKNGSSSRKINWEN